MFANAEGGILLIGVPEQRDAQGQPTGIPNPAGPLGINVPNPEAALLALDARVTAGIEERLQLKKRRPPPLRSAPFLTTPHGWRLKFAFWDPQA